MDADPSEPVDPTLYYCPECGRSLISTESAPFSLHCPDCGRDYASGDADSRGPAQGADEELSELRIRQIAQLKRSAYRIRSWQMIAAGVCLVAAAKFAEMAVAGFRRGTVSAAIGDVLCASAAVMIAMPLLGRIRATTRELREASRKPPPAVPPDFSNLGDGSARVEALERLGRDEGND